MNTPNKSQREVLALQRELTNAREKLLELIKQVELIRAEDVSLLNLKGRMAFSARINKVNAEITTIRAELQQLTLEFDDAIKETGDE